MPHVNNAQRPVGKQQSRHEEGTDKETTELNQQEPKKQESRVQESSENDHKEQDRSMPSLPAGSKDEVKSTEPISVKVVDERFNELAKKELREKNPAYGRQSISRPMRIVAPIPQ